MPTEVKKAAKVQKDVLGNIYKPSQVKAGQTAASASAALNMDKGGLMAAKKKAEASRASQSTKTRPVSPAVKAARDKKARGEKLSSHEAMLLKVAGDK